MSRIIQISQDQKEGATEEDKDSLDITEFAKLMSVFSIRATREQKLRYAFKIYDYDGDGRIGKDDLQQTLEVITNNKMEPEFMTAVVDQVTSSACSMSVCKHKTLHVARASIDLVKANTSMLLRGGCAHRSLPKLIAIKMVSLSSTISVSP